MNMYGIDGKEIPMSNPLMLEQERKYNSLLAEFENYRKRTEREKREIAAQTTEKVMKEFFDVFDDIHRCVVKVSELTYDDFHMVSKAIALVAQKLDTTMQHIGLEMFEPEAGDPFDAERHEAVARCNSSYPKDTITDVHMYGYKLNGKIVRYPKVVVSSGRLNFPGGSNNA